MLNNVSCAAKSLGRAAYNNSEAVVLLLCRECAAELDELGLSADAAKATRLYLDKYDNFYETGKISEFTFLRDNTLQHVIVAGCGSGRDCRPNNFRKAAGEAVRAALRLKIKELTVAAPIILNSKRGHYLTAIAEGLYLGAYTFSEYKSEQGKKQEVLCKIISGVEDAAGIIAAAETVADAVSLARNLANRPGNALTPEDLAVEAEKIAATFGLECEILGERELREKNMNAILAVGQGSVHKPKMISLKYNGAGDAPYTAYVGKGITFDSGGISIKPSENMGEMKDDMSGAAAALAAIKGIASLQKRCNVIAVMACAENMPDGNAQRPGDIVRAANGKTIEVVNTDAEGRMVLADAVWYACRQGAAKVIDIATLTGAVSVALGTETAGVVANDDALAAAIRTTGKKTGEFYWQLPSSQELKEALKSDVADLVNSAGRAGGCITGGLFIGEFVDAEVPWAHIDIGGTSTAAKTNGHIVKGSTGSGVMTLIKLAEEL
ncbi:MAG: leucyl aminopeptidase [Acidaminococcaceae bacterium]|nr:leucyl aminopeptidase [Acidaminococcaceae bacterium]